MTRTVSDPTSSHASSSAGLKAFLKRPPAVALWAATATLVGILGASAIGHELRLRSGQELCLAVRPIDPREVLLGHYVQLGYAVGDSQPLAPLIGAGDMTAIRTALEGDGGEIWAIFESKPDAPARLAAISLDRPSNLPEGRIAVRTTGALTEIYPDRPAMEADETSPAVTPESGVTIRIGQDRYYADQSEAEALEATIRTGREDVCAILSVSPEGEPALRGIKVADKRVVPGWF